MPRSPAHISSLRHELNSSIHFTLSGIIEAYTPNEACTSVAPHIKACAKFTLFFFKKKGESNL